MRPEQTVALAMFSGAVLMAALGAWFLTQDDTEVGIVLLVLAAGDLAMASWFLRRRGQAR
ncbi:hypothetical protein [Kytococcus sedentarius]|uniref:hypothetical protein n=1 Tax=Kytococcus sedentarius TaxID=1276 RepID=UPI0019512797|nr:hypothetical protein [Kytococcus sedentarius]QRO86653.1 hypothetical protein I6J30_07160 [Kytococcus sedentarius]